MMGLWCSLIIFVVNCRCNGIFLISTTPLIPNTSLIPINPRDFHPLICIQHTTDLYHPNDLHYLTGLHHSIRFHHLIWQFYVQSWSLFHKQVYLVSENFNQQTMNGKETIPPLTADHSNAHISQTTMPKHVKFMLKDMLMCDFCRISEEEWTTKCTTTHFVLWMLQL